MPQWFLFVCLDLKRIRLRIQEWENGNLNQRNEQVKPLGALKRAN